jgi:hypothetical protein
MKKYLFLGALCALLSPAWADTVGTYGDVQVVTGPDGNPAWQLTSSPGGVGYAGLYVEFDGSITPADLTELAADYVMLGGTFDNGAPRFSIIDTTNNTNNEAYVYWGTPEAGGSFSDPNNGNSTYAGTGNYADDLSADLRVQNNGFGGGSTGASYETWSQFVSSEGTVGIGFITIDLDGGFSSEQVMDVGSFDINGTTYTPQTSAVPEPGGISLLFGCACGALFFVRRLARRSN